MRKLRSRLFIAAGCSLVTIASSSYAAIEEQIVTTQRKEENIQSVPVSVTAFNADNLQQLGVDDPQSMADFVANVSIGDGTGRSSVGAQFSIRGVNEARIAPVLDPAVAVYIDDVYYGRPETNFLKLLDVQRVEVLRGPQGTLFGKNSTGGAVRYVTRRPETDSTFGEISVKAGNNEQLEFEGSVNVPLSENAAIRLAGAHIERDGYVKRLSDGVNLGETETDFFNGQLRLTPMDNLTIDFNASYTESSDNGGATKLIDYFGFNGANDVNSSARSNSDAFRWNRLYGGTSLEFNPAIPTSLYQVAGEGRVGSTDTESTGLGLDIVYDINDSLTLRSITGYREVDVLEDREANDHPAFGFFDNKTRSGVDFWSQEFQLNGISMDDRLSWVAGLFYSEEEPFSQDLDDRDYATFSTGNPNSRVRLDGAGALILNDGGYQTTKSTGVFAQGDYLLTDDLTLTLGLRWSEDDKSFQISQTGSWDESFAQMARTALMELPANDPRRALIADLNDDLVPCRDGDLDGRASCATSPTLSGGDTFQSWTPRIALEYQANDDTMIYAAASKGFKSGGTNDTVADIGTPFDPEELVSYETGIRLQGENIRASLTAFFMDYTDKQLTVTSAEECERRCTTNVGDAEIKGIEAELLANLTDNLQFNLGVGALDAEWVDIQNPAAGVTTESSFGRAPGLSVTAGLRYDRMLDNGANITSTVNVGYKDDQESSGQNSTTLSIPSYAVTNARISYVPADANWDVSLYCTNCLDEEYITGGAAWAGSTDGSGFNYKPLSHPTYVYGGTNPAANAAPGITIVNIGAPLFWGVDFTYKFGN